MEVPEGATIAVVATLLFLWSLVARRAERLGVSAPMAFIVAGAVLSAALADGLSPSTIRFLAELTLVLVLFHDASTVRLADLRRDPGVPLRLLLIGFPLAILLTAASTLLVLPAAGLALAVLIAGSITPTDAGLGAPTILNPVVPIRVRRALNVESGLNDGLATPIVLGALSVLVRESGADVAAGPLVSVLDLAARPVLLAVAIGLGPALVGAWLTDRSRSADWSSLRGRGLAVLALPLLMFGLALLLEANVFVAAFVGGLAFGWASRCVNEEVAVSQTVETATDLFSAVLWFLAGGLVVQALDGGVRWQWVVLALAALTLLRTGPVALALLGTGFGWQTVTFLGWFGPRGIATIVFGLITVEEFGQDQAMLADVAGVLSTVVFISVFAHGLSAGPLSQRYGAWVARAHPPIELEPSVEPLPSRGRRAAHDQM